MKKPQVYMNIIPIPLLRFSLSSRDEVLESLLMPLCCPRVVLLLSQSQSFTIWLLDTRARVKYVLEANAYGFLSAEAVRANVL